MNIPQSIPLQKWLDERKIQLAPFQVEVFQAFQSGKSGILTAPTGMGKTLAIWLPFLQKMLSSQATPKGVQLIWVSPMRALGLDLAKRFKADLEALGLPLRVAVRNGDTPQSEKQKQNRKKPSVLIITPENLHLLLASKQNHLWFKNLEALVIDEWHDLLNSKRSVLMQLAIATLRTHHENLPIWGISATLAKPEQALKVMLGHIAARKAQVIQANKNKQLHFHLMKPPHAESFPGYGEIGKQMVEQILAEINHYRSVLFFTNTRFQAEFWYRHLLAHAPDLAGNMALHHSTIDKNTRLWVEGQLGEGNLQVVISTSGLDLGVDFSPVEAIFQLGSPKHINRFLQRAGRSGHQPGAAANIYFIPTNILEILEATAIQQALQHKVMEAYVPYEQSFDVLLQFMITLACGDGLYPEKLWETLRQTHAYEGISRADFDKMLRFLYHGGESLQAYDEYHKIYHDAEKQAYFIAGRRKAMLHRLSIGVIRSEELYRVKFLHGKKELGRVEAYFLHRLKKGDVFTIAGRTVRLAEVKDDVAFVKKSKAQKALMPIWSGEKLSLSPELSQLVRKEWAAAVEAFKQNKLDEVDGRECLQPFLSKQATYSSLPKVGAELLVEYIKSRQGYHLYIYPFLGKKCHDAMAALIAHRIAARQPIGFSMSANDYGFELLSADELPIEAGLLKAVFKMEDLEKDLQESLNATEMSKQKFKEIAVIAGLFYTRFPGKQKGAAAHLRASAQLVYEVFKKREPEHFLLQQAEQELATQTLDVPGLKSAMEILAEMPILLTQPKRFTPLAFPLMVARLRQYLSSEDLADRIERILGSDAKK